MGFIALLLNLLAFNKFGGDIVGWDAVLICLVTGSLMGWWYGRHKPAIPPISSPIYRPFTLSLDEGGFRIESEGYDTHIKWGQVTNLREAGGCLQVVTRLDGTHILPLRAFATTDEAQKFLRHIHELREAVVNPTDRMPLERMHYRLTQDDARAFFDEWIQERGWRKGLFYLLAFLFIVVYVTVNATADDEVWWLGMALAIGLAWSLSKLILWLNRRIAISRYPLLAGEVELQRWGDHLRLIAEGETVQTAYRSIGYVLATKEHVFVMTSPEQGIIVPKRAFKEEAAMASFARQVDKEADESQP